MDHRVDIVDGALLRIAGPEDAPTLLLLHAFADTGYAYAGLFASDALKSYRLVAVDLWGFGASPRRADVRTVDDYAKALGNLINAHLTDRSIGLVGHSIAGTMAVAVANRLGDKVTGVFSIEGNLTPDDAFFTGRAKDYDDPDLFKRDFLDQVWQLGQESPALRQYYAGAVLADARTMWDLGNDAVRISDGDRLGQLHRALARPSLYYWSTESTPAATRDWIENSDIAHEVYTGAGHWPMVEQPEETARAIGRFFDRILAG